MKNIKEICSIISLILMLLTFIMVVLVKIHQGKLQIAIENLQEIEIIVEPYAE